MKFFTSWLLLIFLSVNAIAQTSSPLPAEEVLKTACERAKNEKKNVLLMFSASWCGWCHKMAASLNDPVCKDLFDQNYVITRLIVDESGEKAVLENPGVDEFREKYHGDDQGIPFWLVFDASGKWLADSKIRNPGDGPEAGMNIGCPASDPEVDYFIQVLKKTSRLNEDQLEIIRKRFKENKM